MHTVDADKPAMDAEPHSSAPTETAKPLIVCPNCGHPIPGALVMEAVEGQSVEFAIHPTPGGLLSARTAGQLIDQFGRLLDALSKDLGLNEKAYVSKLSTDEDGTIRIRVLHAPTRLRKKPSSAEQTEDATSGMNNTSAKAKGPQQP